MLDQCRRLWADAVQMLYKWSVFAGMDVREAFSHHAEFKAFALKIIQNTLSFCRYVVLKFPPSK